MIFNRHRIKLWRFSVGRSRLHKYGLSWWRFQRNPVVVFRAGPLYVQWSSRDRTKG